MKAEASVSLAAMAVPGLTGDVEGEYRCKDGFLNAADIGKAAGVGWKAARRAIDAYVAASATGDEKRLHGAMLRFGNDVLPAPGTLTRAELGEIVARRVGIGRFRIANEVEKRAATKPPRKERRRMPTQDHPYKTGQQGRSLRNESGGVVAVLTCGKHDCETSDEVRFRQLCDAAVMDRKFKNKGWGLDPARCPEHNGKERHTMTLKPAANAAANGRMFVLLQEHFDPDKGAYGADWSDAKVAAETGLALEYVAAVRTEALGPLREPPEVEQLRSDIAAVEALLAEEEGRVRSIRDMVEGLRSKAGELSKRFAA